MNGDIIITLKYIKIPTITSIVYGLIVIYFLKCTFIFLFYNYDSRQFLVKAIGTRNKAIKGDIKINAKYINIIYHNLKIAADVSSFKENDSVFLFKAEHTKAW